MSVRTVAEGARGRAAAPDSVSAGEARSARAFEAARRHSRLVRILRTALIFGAVGGVAVLTGLALYRTFGSALGQLSIGELSIDGTKITMDRPRLTGARPDGGAYVINAAKAIQDIKHPTDVDLVGIEGDIVPPDRDTLHLTATSGHYDSGREQLDLSGVVRLKNSSYSIDLKSAHIDFKTGGYSSRDPVTVVTTSGASITADSGSARDNGKEITFEGHAKTTIRPGGAEPYAGDAIKGTQP
jgi:lipopolysaccharide export system protein LptC